MDEPAERSHQRLRKLKSSTRPTRLISFRFMDPPRELRDTCYEAIIRSAFEAHARYLEATSSEDDPADVTAVMGKSLELVQEEAEEQDIRDRAVTNMSNVSQSRVVDEFAEQLKMMMPRRFQLLVVPGQKDFETPWEAPLLQWSPVSPRLLLDLNTSPTCRLAAVEVVVYRRRSRCSRRGEDESTWEGRVSVTDAKLGIRRSKAEIASLRIQGHSIDDCRIYVHRLTAYSAWHMTGVNAPYEEVQDEMSGFLWRCGGGKGLLSFAGPMCATSSLTRCCKTKARTKVAYEKVEVERKSSWNSRRWESWRQQ